MRRYIDRIRVIVLCCYIIAIGHSLPVESWQWPLEGAFSLGTGQISEGFVFRLVPSTGKHEEFEYIAEGDVVYRAYPEDRFQALTSGIPRSAETVFVEHGNGFASGYFFPPSVDGSVRWLEFSIWDVVHQTQVNPRILLASREGVPDTGMPTIRIVQEGQIVAPGSVVPGEIAVIADLRAWESTGLPWSVTASADGGFEAHHRFVFFRGAPASHEYASTFELLRFEVPPGVTVVEVEIVHFDRRRERRTIRLRVTDPAAVDPD